MSRAPPPLAQGSLVLIVIRKPNSAGVRKTIWLPNTVIFTQDARHIRVSLMVVRERERERYRERGKEGVRKPERESETRQST